ncbi:hypothetical protein BY996DRAFT_4585613 [Phakopsora pachyrhizi]|nr:hypothetical protein BY996DRAFT_4585613 [Phakopsora pachyrhizi]
MSNTEVENRTNDTGGLPNGNSHGDDDQAVLTFINRIAGIPVVTEALEVFQSTVHSYKPLSIAYGKAEGAASFLYEQSRPLQQKLSGQIHQVDVVANKGLDFIQSKAPSFFEIRTEDILSKARQPADQAYAYGKTYKDAASAKLGPLVEQFYAQLTRSQQTLFSLQEKLNTGLQNVRKDPKAVPDQIKHLTDQLIGEVGKLSQLLAEKRHDLPQQAQQAMGPLVEKLQKAYGDIKEEMTKAETPLTQRASNVLQYSRDQTLPIVHEAIQTIKKVIGNSPN